MAFKASSAFSVGDSETTSRTITRGTWLTGEFIVIIGYVEQTGLTLSLTGGTWFNIPQADGQQTAGSIDYETHVFVCAVAGGDSGNVVITWGGASVWNVFIGGVYTGRNVANGFDNGAFSASGSAGTTVTCPPMTINYAGSDEIATGHNAGGRAHSWSSGTERADLGGQSFADKLNVGTGTTPAFNATIFSEFWSSGHLALRIAGSTVYTLAAAAGAYALTGSAAGLRSVRKLVAVPGSYALTGSAATLKRRYTLSAAAGSYSLTGTAVTLRSIRRLSAGEGSYELVGSNVVLRSVKRLTAEAGSYELVGSDVTFKRNYALSADAGQYDLVGSNITLRFNRVLKADEGSYELTGSDTNLKRIYTLAAASGLYSLDGSDASLVYITAGEVFTLVAEPGSYNLTGSDVTLRAIRKLVAESGSYELTGSAARAVLTLDEFPECVDGGGGINIPQIIND